MATRIRLIEQSTDAALQQVLAMAHPTELIQAPAELRTTAKVNALVRDVSALDKESHSEMYLFLRNYAPADVFTTDYTGTHFSVDSLTDIQLTELYKIVAMCKENAQRSQTINDATTEYMRAMGGKHVVDWVIDASAGKAPESNALSQTNDPSQSTIRFNRIKRS